jgi:hypothetical protein
MSINALLLIQNLPNAQLIIYPDASHAAFSQHAETFLKHVQLFFPEIRWQVNRHQSG